MWSCTKNNDEECCLKLIFLCLLNKEIKNQPKKVGLGLRLLGVI